MSFAKKIFPTIQQVYYIFFCGTINVINAKKYDSSKLILC